MTRNKAGHNLSREDSAEVPVPEGSPVTEDGPEGYSEYGPVKEPEDRRSRATYAKSNNSSSKGQNENYRKLDTETGISGSGRRTVPDPPRMTTKFLALKSCRHGSPFAYLAYQKKHDFFKGLLVDSTCVLFDQVVAEASSLRERLSASLPLANNGRHGRICALKNRDSPSVDHDSSEESNSNESELQLYGFESNVAKLSFSVFVDPATAATRIVKLPGVRIIDSSIKDTYTASGRSKDDRIIEVGRFRNPTTGEIEFLVKNWSIGLLRINGIDVEPTLVAGPLPDFAVLEVANTSIFWWRTADALDYMPSLKRKRDYEDSDASSVGKVSRGDTVSSPNSRVSDSQLCSSHASDSHASESHASESQASESQVSSPQVSSPQVSDPQVLPDSKSWLQEYRHRLSLCKQRPVKYTSLITEDHPPHQYPAGEMHYTDVILAIGAVWLGLKDAKVDFAYANSNLFSFARSMRMIGMHAVNKNQNFLIPLLFNDELQALSAEPEEDTAEPLEPVFSEFQRREEEKYKENFVAAEKAKHKDPGNKNKPPPSLEEQKIQNGNHKGGIGHFMLAVAEKVNQHGPNSIKDALAKKALVRLRFMDSADGTLDRGMIRRVARNTVRNAGWLGDIWPYFDANEEYWVDVLGQSGNRCGEHTVLNAWAYMLDIPLATTRKRALGTQSYNEVRGLMRLALRGQLDSLTIRAWMQHYKYAVDEPLSQLQQTQIQNSGSVNNLRNMQTVALNEDAFNEIVNNMYRQGLDKNQNYTTSRSDIPVVSDVATTEQSGHAPHVATELTMPPSIQAPVASSPGIDGVPTNPTGPAENPPRIPAPDPSPRSWQESLLQGLMVNSSLRAKNPRTTKDGRKNATVIRDPSHLADYDVILGIAPIWEGLKRLGRPGTDFTYAGTDVFLPGEMEPIGAVGGWSRFIMPLYFSPVGAEALEHQGKGKAKIKSVGHLVLCVAELVNELPMTVQLSLYDSRPNTVPMGHIWLEARRIIIHSGWLGPNISAAQVVFNPIELIRSPAQVGHNTCGLFTILNAWAVMLDIPLHPHSLRRGRAPNDELFDDVDPRFLALGLELVNLALEGFMDSATIQAFFNVYGYSVEQRFLDPVRAVVPVNAVGMNISKFGLTLQRRKWSSMLASAREESTRFSDADMAYLMDQGLSDGQAWTALVIAGGDRNQAVQWHFDSDNPGQLPRPEGALSPTTPDRGGDENQNRE